MGLRKGMLTRDETQSGVTSTYSAKKTFDLSLEISKWPQGQEVGSDLSGPSIPKLSPSRVPGMVCGPPTSSPLLGPRTLWEPRPLRRTSEAQPSSHAGVPHWIIQPKATRYQERSSQQEL